MPGHVNYLVDDVVAAVGHYQNKDVISLLRHLTLPSGNVLSFKILSAHGFVFSI